MESRLFSIVSKMSQEPLKFVPFQLFIDPAFWAEVSRRRLDEWQLQEPIVDLIGSYGICKLYRIFF